MPQPKVFPKLVNLAVFILLEIASLYLITHNAPLQRTWVARAGHAFMGSVWGSTQSLRSYFSLAGTNRALAQENQQLLSELISAREKLQRLKVDSLQMEVAPGFSLIPAEIVVSSRNRQHNYLILNRGYADGVKDKSGIITPRGVVGIVDAVSEHHAFVFSFQNSDVSISARLGGEGSQGILVWDGITSNGALLKEVPLHYRYQPGDTVFTSGHSVIFPPDIPLGLVGDSRVINGSTNEISVVLFQDFKALRYVGIVHNNSLNEIEELVP